MHPPKVFKLISRESFLRALPVICCLISATAAGGASEVLPAESQTVHALERRSVEVGTAQASRETILWTPEPGAGPWVWEKQFDSVRQVGAILQVNGDHSFVLKNAPSTYLWLGSEDGLRWFKLPEASIVDERRLVRVHKLSHPRILKAVRLKVTQANGAYPAVRDIEILEREPPALKWAVVVNTTEEKRLPGHGQDFIPLVHASNPDLLVQQVNLEDFNPAFLRQNPPPLCAFLSGNFKDWCEVDRERWRGTEEVLKNRQLPIWASCGGAQGLAILATVGVDKPWDCPHCRDEGHPLLPVYSHIGHTAQKDCGDYSGCIFERGPHHVVKVGMDPVFEGLPAEFNAMESHCGQINFAPKGWKIIAAAGAETLTKVQCLKLRGSPIYAAQFHIEMTGTPETSRQIMRNFLDLADAANGKR